MMSPIVVGAQELRRLFNDRGEYYAEKLRTRELVQKVMSDKHPSEPLAGEPFCTRSQMVEYQDTRSRSVARLHQYKRKDGSIGLSGRPDPKSLLIDGRLYMVAPE